jgi:hypothetical protein
MKKILALMILAIVALASAIATDTTLTPDSMSMDYNDVQTVEFCMIDSLGTPMDVTLLVDPICRDVDSLLGCSGADVLNPAGFAVVPVTPTTGIDGCANLTITTNLAANEGGLFFYTVNGQIAGTTVGTETGRVFVPEMGVLGAAIVLAGVGLFVARKRKE